MRFLSHRFRSANAVLHLLLLSGVLALVNLVGARLLPATWDLTSRKLFTLSPQTARVLAGLKQPVQIFVLASRVQRTTADRAFAQTQVMLDDLLELYRQNCPLMELRTLDPDDSDAARRLMQRYPDVTVPGMVLVHGNGEGARHEVLRQGDLVAASHTGGRRAGVDFLGEQALTAALSRLASGRRQTVVYCLTGHGELDLDDAEFTSPRGLGTLAAHLRLIDCELRPLDLQTTDRVPADAGLLLLAGPNQPYSSAEVARLRSYLLHGGRALMLFDLIHDPLTGRPLESGLEELLADYGVLVGTDRVVTRGYTGQMHAASPALPAAAGHPLARSLPAAALTLYECRSVRLLASVRQNQTQAAPLLISHPWPRAWAQDAADGTSSAGNATLRGPVSMAVAVERRSTAQPVLVVAGDGEFAGNRALALPAGRLSYGLLVASVNWLRGRKELLADIPPLRHEPYQLAGDPADHRTLVWTSSLLLCAAIVTAGTTIWTVRRTG